MLSTTPAHIPWRPLTAAVLWATWPCVAWSSTHHRRRQHFLPLHLSSDESSRTIPEAFDILAAKRQKTWKRLGHLVDLAWNAAGRSIADVGCDHGLLATGLALTGNYSQVLGVDLSSNALEGAHSLLENLQCHDPTGQLSDNLSFRVSNGLENVDAGEADAICIAGMGVNTMLKILQAPSRERPYWIDLKSETLVLQPTNSKPKNLLLLYDYLQESGWSLQEERIEYLSRRWYLTSRFVRGTSSHLPTSKLSPSNRQAYVDHHVQWMNWDEQASGKPPRKRELAWREMVTGQV